MESLWVFKFLFISSLYIYSISYILLSLANDVLENVVLCFNYNILSQIFIVNCFNLQFKSMNFMHSLHHASVSV